MRVYGNIESVRNELHGKTGLLPELEEDLMQRIADIESEHDSIPRLRKTDWRLIAGSVVICILLSVTCFI